MNLNHFAVFSLLCFKFQQVTFSIFIYRHTLIFAFTPFAPIVTEIDTFFANLLFSWRPFLKNKKKYAKWLLNHIWTKMIRADFVLILIKISFHRFLFTSHQPIDQWPLPASFFLILPPPCRLIIGRIHCLNAPNRSLASHSRSHIDRLNRPVTPNPHTWPTILIISPFFYSAFPSSAT